MGKKILIAAIAVIVILIALCLIPSPLSGAMAADGGTKIIYTTIIPVVHVIDWNHFQWSPREKTDPKSESYDPDYPRSETVMGKQIYFFGVCVYDGRHTVPGNISRSERDRAIGHTSSAETSIKK